MDNRLLSDNEQMEAHGCSMDNHECTDALLSAQLAKADKEWVEWVTTVHAECRCGVCPQYGRDCVLFTPNCIKWQERKKEIGIESTT